MKVGGPNMPGADADLAVISPVSLPAHAPEPEAVDLVGGSTSHTAETSPAGFGEIGTYWECRSPVTQIR
jgi:hypothetical protein